MPERDKPDFSKPDHYLAWLKKSEEHRQCFEEDWQTYWAMYEHEHPHAKGDDCQVYQVNKVFSTVNVILASTALEYPHITVTPKDPESTPAAQLAEHTINCMWRRGNVQDCIREAWKDSIIIGHGWAKTTWRFEEKEYTSPKKISDKDRRTNEAAARAIAHPVDELKLNNDTEGNSRVTFDEAVVQRISPWDMYVDPNAKSMRDIRWIAQKVRMTNEELHAKGGDLAKGGWRKSAINKATASKREDLERRPEGAPRDCDQWVDVWEFYDVARGEMAIFAENADDFLRDPAPSPYPFGHPFVYFGNHEITERLYDMGDVKAITDLQDELNQTRTDIMNHRKRYRVKYWYRDGLPSETIDGIKSAEEDCLVPIPEGEDIQDVFGVIPQIQIPADFYNQSLMISSDLDEVSGVSEYQRGKAVSGGTATEAAIGASAAQARSSEKLRRLERGMATIAENMLGLMQKYLTNDLVLRIAGVKASREYRGSIEESGVEYDSDREIMWIKVDRELIAGEFDFEVEAGSTQPNNEALRSQRAIQVLSLLTPYVASGLVDSGALLRWALEQLGFQNPDRFLTGGGDQASLQQAGSVSGVGLGTDPATAANEQRPVGTQQELPGAISQLNAQLGVNL